MSEINKKKLIHRYTEEIWVEDGEAVPSSLGELRPEDSAPDEDDCWDEDDEDDDDEEADPGCGCDGR